MYLYNIIHDSHADPMQDEYTISKPVDVYPYYIIIYNNIAFKQNI